MISTANNILISILTKQGIFLLPQTLSCFMFRVLMSALDMFFLENISAYLKLRHTIRIAFAVATKCIDSGVKTGKGANDIHFVKAD